MSVELTVEDGNPWYLSPDIWVVPGSDPSGPPGQPMAGSPAFLWARVHNTGSTAVAGAKVRYWVADPTAGPISASNALAIGESDVSLDAGETREVLCVSPWVVAGLGGGHVCAVVEASHSLLDPITPPRTPTTPFAPPTDRHQAQRNLHVIELQALRRPLIHRFRAGAHLRGTSRILTARRSRLETIAKQLQLLGLPKMPAEAEGIAFELRRSSPWECEDVTDGGGDQAVDVADEETFALVVSGDDRIPIGSAVLILVEEREADETVGGLGLLIVASERTK